MTRYFRLILPLFCALCLTFTACEKEDNPNINWGGTDQPKPKPNPTPDQPTPQPSPQLDAQGRADAARLEMPALTGENGELFIVHRVINPHGPDSILNYAYAYLPQSFHSRWVAFRFDAQT